MNELQKNQYDMIMQLMNELNTVFGGVDDLLQTKNHDVNDLNVSVIKTYNDFTIELRYISACGLFVIDVNNLVDDNFKILMNIDNNVYNTNILIDIKKLIDLHYY